MFPFCMRYKIEPPLEVASLSFFHLRAMIGTKVIFFMEKTDKE